MNWQNFSDTNQYPTRRFFVEYSSASGDDVDTKIVTGRTATSHTAHDLRPATTHTFRLQAEFKDGTKSGYSNGHVYDGRGEGGAGDDNLYGQGGDKELRGWSGDDYTRGVGEDRFVFSPWESGDKVIHDFASGEYVIVLIEDASAGSWPAVTAILGTQKQTPDGVYVYDLRPDLTVETDVQLTDDDFELE